MFVIGVLISTVCASVPAAEESVMVQGGKQTGAYMAIEYPAGGVPTFVTKKFMVALAGTVKENSIGTPRVELDPGSLIQFVQYKLQ
jgi:hypothetical protein